MPRCVKHLELVWPHGDNIAVVQRLGAFKEVCFLMEVSPPGRPIVPGVDKVFSNVVHRDIASRQLLNEMVAADMIAMGVGIDDERHAAKIHSHTLHAKTLRHAKIELAKAHKRSRAHSFLKSVAIFTSFCETFLLAKSVPAT